jgi:hypothetical protein
MEYWNTGMMGEGEEKDQHVFPFPFAAQHPIVPL